MPPLEACSPIDDSKTKAIAETMPNLKQINLCFGRFGDMGLSEILMKCKSLTHLDIQGSWNVELNGDLEESGSSDDDESKQESESD
nr:F-box protein FBW2-like [Tanacetum cinerariifolium]